MLDIGEFRDYLDSEDAISLADLFINPSVDGESLVLKKLPLIWHSDDRFTSPYNDGIADVALVEAVRRYGKATLHFSSGFNTLGPLGAIAISKLTRLRTLNLIDAYLGARELNTIFENLESLESIIVAGCRITDECVSALKNLKHLYSIDLGSPLMLSNEAIREIVMIPTLESVALSQNTDIGLHKSDVKSIHELRPDVSFYPSYED